jgi:hypothetical protein
VEAAKAVPTLSLSSKTGFVTALYVSQRPSIADQPNQTDSRGDGSTAHCMN